MGEIRHLSLRIDEHLLREFRFVCAYFGRSANSQMLFMIRRTVEQFQQKHGRIESDLE